MLANVLTNKIASSHSRSLEKQSYKSLYAKLLETFNKAKRVAEPSRKLAALKAYTVSKTTAEG
jgi:hypothetical protein